MLYSSWVLSDSVTPWTARRQAPLSSIISGSLLKFLTKEHETEVYILFTWVFNTSKYEIRE